MGKIQEKIASFLPEAVFEEGQYLTVTVAPRKWHGLARFLHDDPELQFGISDRNGLGRDAWCSVLSELYEI